MLEGEAFKCDQCFVPFSSMVPDLEPVSVGCHHTICRACSQLGLQAPSYGDENANKNDANKDDKPPSVGRKRSNCAASCGVCEFQGEKAVVRRWVLDAVRAHEEADHEGGEAEFEDSDDENENENEGDAHHRISISSSNINGGDDSPRQPSRSRVLAPAAEPDHPVCEPHGQPATRMCLDDGCMVCEACVLEAHKGHRIDHVHNAMHGITKAALAEAARRVGELEDAEEGLVASRMEVTKSAREAEEKVNAFFDEIGKQRDELLRRIRLLRKEIGQRLNDVRTTARVLRQGKDALHAAIAAIRETPRRQSIDTALEMHQQVKELLKASNRINIGAHGVTFGFSTPCTVAEWRASCKIVDTKYTLTGYDKDEPWQPHAVEPVCMSPMAQPRAFHGSCKSGNSDVYIAGGFSRAGYLAAVDHYDVFANVWGEVSTLPTQRRPSGACMAGHYMVVVGGVGTSGVLDVVEAYDTQHAEWLTFPKVPVRMQACVVVGWDHQVCVIGGRDVQGQSLGTAWVLDTRRKELDWDPLPPMTHKRSWACGATGRGQAFVCGGMQSDTSFLSSCEALHLDGRAWSPLPPMPLALYCSGAGYGGGNLVVSGGHNGKSRVACTLVLSVSNGVWMTLPDTSVATTGCSVACTRKRICVFGGTTGKRYTDRCEVYEF